MDKTKREHHEKKEAHPLPILALLSQWANQHKQNKLLSIGIALSALTILVFLFTWAVRNFENSWYSVYFLSKSDLSLWGIILIIVNIIRWSLATAFLALCILGIIASENSQLSDSLQLVTARFFVWSIIIGSLLIGLQNIILYSVIGWKYIGTTQIGEGISVFLIATSVILVVVGRKFQLARKTIFLESMFNLVLIMLPVVLIITISLGGWDNNPQWIKILFVLVNLFILIVGVDELRGKPSLYTHLVTAYSIFEAGHVSLQTLRKRSAEALSDALQVYKLMTPEQQESLAKWILDNNKPSFVNRFWAIAKIVVSTILLTTLVQEPAIIFFKWFLKTVLGFSY
jgi:hypothetical protein